MSTKEEDLNLNSQDMISFWRDGYMRNPILRFHKEKAQKYAEDQYRLWKKTGISFEELLEDYKKSEGTEVCPKNIKTGKNWHAILQKTFKKMENKDYSDPNAPAEIYPHALVQSTIKYFKSKLMMKGAIIEEEKERNRIRDSR